MSTVIGFLAIYASEIDDEDGKPSGELIDPDPVAGARALDEKQLAEQFELAERQMQIWTERCVILDNEIKRRK